MEFYYEKVPLISEIMKTSNFYVKNSYLLLSVPVLQSKSETEVFSFYEERQF